MSIRNRIRTLACCIVLQAATLIGMPMRPEQVQELMRSLNQPKLARTTPQESRKDDARRSASSHWALSCQETPKRSLIHAKRVLNP